MALGGRPFALDKDFYDQGGFSVSPLEEITWGGYAPPDPPINGFASSSSLVNFDYENHISLWGAFNMTSMLFLTQGKASTHTRATQKTANVHTHTHKHTHNAPTFAPYTQREEQHYRWGGEGAAPSVLLSARAQRAPLFVCGANVGALLCVCELS